MKTLVIYYSFSGNCQLIAESFNNSIDVDIVKIRELSKRTNLSAYTMGIFKAMNKRGSNILPLDVDMNHYHSICLITPVWAGSLPPAVYSFIREYNVSRKSVHVILCFKSNYGESSNIVKDEFAKFNVKVKSIALVKAEKDTLLAFKNKTSYFYIGEDEKLHFS